MATAYHQVAREQLKSILSDGLLQGSEGDKTDADIRDTDLFLNEHRPPEVIAAGIDRQRNIYCYLTDGDKVIDITSGESKPRHNILTDPDQVLLKLTVDPDRCFVSDLDLFDEVKSLLKAGQIQQANERAITYWECLTVLRFYDRQVPFRRPELMVPYDLPPDVITVISS